MIACGQDHSIRKEVGVFGLFCYIVAEDEWAMGRAHGGGEWWTFLVESGE